MRLGSGPEVVFWTPDSQCWLTKRLRSGSTQLQDCAKVVPYFRASIYYSQKYFLSYWSKNWRRDTYRDTKRLQAHFIFTRARIEECKVIQRIVSINCGMLGQKVNAVKSSYRISPSVRPSFEDLICQRGLGLMGVLISGRNLHKADFQPIISAIEGRITLYTSMYLSLAGRSTLMKASIFFNAYIRTRSLQCAIWGSQGKW